MIVPNTANAMIVPKFLKKAFLGTVIALKYLMF